MIITPKVRGFICTTAHPAGCAAHVQSWIQALNHKPALESLGLPKKVLIIGASTGFGLASRIVSAFGAGAATIGISFERPASGHRTASPGWYNTAAFEREARTMELYAKSINGDAFSDAVKQQTIDLIQQDWGGEVDLVIYSIASPKRLHPRTGQTLTSVLKPIDQAYRNKTVNIMDGTVADVALEPATPQEIADTIGVMGGEDWQWWMQALLKHQCLAPKAKTLAFTYIGPTFTYPIYRQGTIGQAKLHLEQVAHQLDAELREKIGGQALISVNKALVTQASAAIPVVPLYIALLYHVMKAQGLHEGCLEQMWRLFHERLYQDPIPRDDQGRIRLDDWEMRPSVQEEVQKRWAEVSTDNLATLADVAGYQEDFYNLFGFRMPGMDYANTVSIDTPIPSITDPHD